MPRILTTPFLILLSCSLGLAQRQLVLVKGESNVVTRYSEGDRIRLREKGKYYFKEGIITGIHRTFIKLGEEDTISIYSLDRIDLRHQPNTNFKTATSGVHLIEAGVGLLILSAITTDGGVPPGTATVSAAFIGLGVFLQFVNNNYFKIGRRKKAVVLGN